MAKVRKERKKRNIPTGKNEDVEYSEELADIEDRKAQKRANAADERAQD